MRLVTILLLFVLVKGEEWGVEPLYKSPCNSLQRFAAPEEREWFGTHDKALWSVERYGEIDVSYLLLYRNGTDAPVMLMARMDIIERRFNETQYMLRGLPDYFENKN